jgi:hypothetical protein
MITDDYNIFISCFQIMTETITSDQGTKYDIQSFVKCKFNDWFTLDLIFPEENINRVIRSIA